MALLRISKLWVPTWAAAAALLARVRAVQAEDHVVVTAAHLHTRGMARVKCPRGREGPQRTHAMVLR